MQKIGCYRLLERVARGGMAEVYLARAEHDGSFGRLVAIKRMLPELAEETAFQELFLGEARLGARIHHSGLVQILGLGRTGTQWYLVLEWIHGRDMRRLVPRAEQRGMPFPPVYAALVALQVCEALHHLHTGADPAGRPLGVVHRDVTPENVLVSFDGTVKLIDLGIATSAGQVSASDSVELRGKTGYLSPEQCLGRPVDARADVFSLGVSLYEWVTGFKLFTGDTDDAVARAITEGRIYAPSYFRPDVPESLEAIVLRALERDPADRYASAWDMLCDLQTFLKENEFAPTRGHLSNYVRQIFADELQGDADRLGVLLERADAARDAEDSSSPVTSSIRIETDRPVFQSDPSGLSRLDEPRPLHLPLSLDRWQTLDDMASRNGIDTELLVSELVEAHLRWR